MAHYTLIARINTGDGRFPFVNVQFSKNRYEYSGFSSIYRRRGV
jgi:hypothetical protein